MLVTLFSQFDTKEFITGVMIFIFTGIIAFLIKKVFRLRPKIHIGVSTENHQINLSYRYWTFGWDKPEFGEQEYTISHTVKIRLENISNADAYSPVLCFSDYSFQFDLEPLNITRLKAGDSIELNGHYYHVINASSKPQFFEEPEFSKLEVVVNYKNSFGMRFHSIFKDNSINYSIISGFKTLKP